MSEEIWHSKFGLEEDPFGVYDYTIEEERGENYPRIKTLAVQKIVELAKSRTNVILAGKKGAGKTTAMAETAKELGEECFGMIGFRTTADIYNYLWDQISDTESEEERKHLEMQFSCGKLRQADLWFEETNCRYWDCRKRDRCRWITKGEEGHKALKDKWKDEIKHTTVTKRKVKDIIWEINYITRSCPMKRLIVNEILLSKPKFFMNKVYLLDIHDEFLTCQKRRDEYIIEKLVAILQQIGNVIITATNEQYNRLKVSENVARIRKVNFPLPTQDELKEIYVERVRAFQQNKSEPLPFDDSAVQALIIYSHNIPRHFIQNCSDVLFAMREQRRDEPADKDFVMKTLGFRTDMNETDAIGLVLAKLQVEGRVWVKVKEIQNVLEGPEFGVVVSARRLGRRLKNEWKLEHRMNPDSEYKIRP